MQKAAEAEEMFQAVADLGHNARGIDPWNVRKIPLHSREAVADIDVDVIDAGGANADQNFARPGARRFNFFAAKDVGPSVPMENDGFHGMSPN